MLGECHMYGRGTARNAHIGLVKLAQAAMLGSEWACYLLASAYRSGRNDIEVDDTQMAYWQAKMQSLARNGKCDADEETRNLVASWRPVGLTAE